MCSTCVAIDEQSSEDIVQHNNLPFPFVRLFADDKQS